MSDIEDDIQATREPDKSEECRLRAQLATVTRQRDEAVQLLLESSDDMRFSGVAVVPGKIAEWLASEGLPTQQEIES